MCKVQISGNDSNKSKLHSRRNEEQIKLGGCLLPFCSGFFAVYPLFCMGVKLGLLDLRGKIVVCSKQSRDEKCLKHLGLKT